jgi:hypothetical protein
MVGFGAQRISLRAVGVRVRSTIYHGTVQALLRKDFSGKASPVR